MQQEVYDMWRRKDLRKNKTFGEYMRVCKQCGGLFRTVHVRPKKCPDCKLANYKQLIMKKNGY